MKEVEEKKEQKNASAAGGVIDKEKAERDEKVDQIL